MQISSKNKNDPIIKVTNLGKKYKIGEKEKYLALRDKLVDSVRTPYRLIKGETSLKKPEIWALKNISFEVKKGEVVGIIGRNGAGKTTLLKILSRIIEPTTGEVVIKGRVGSLLEVGTGFHPELTGRENIYLNGSILGMTKKEINSRFDDIVEFSGIKQFLDTPVKRYSSGMYVRLAFSVSAHLESEILLVDEVLAVGDEEFQRKCLGKMSDISRSGRTILFVSHNMVSINRLCNQVIWLDNSKILMEGLPENVISKYFSNNSIKSSTINWKNGISNKGINEFCFKSIRILDKHNSVTRNIDRRHSFFIEIEYEIKKTIKNCRIGFIIYSGDGTPVLEAYDCDFKSEISLRKTGVFKSICEIPGNMLNVGKYIITLNAGIFGIKNLANIDHVVSFNISRTAIEGNNLNDKRKGIIMPKLKWIVK